MVSGVHITVHSPEFRSWPSGYHLNGTWYSMSCKNFRKSRMVVCHRAGTLQKAGYVWSIYLVKKTAGVSSSVSRGLDLSATTQRVGFVFKKGFLRKKCYRRGAHCMMSPSRPSGCEFHSTIARKGKIAPSTLSDPTSLHD